MADEWLCDTGMDVDHREFIQTADRGTQCPDRNVIYINLEDPIIACISQIESPFPGGSENRII